MKVQYLLATLFFSVCASINAQESDCYVSIKTNMGNMRIKLYNDTPEHRKNFLQLVSKKHFNGTLFYRSVKDFVIQGGSSDSRNAPPGKHIGYGEASINIDSEFRDNRFHKKGAICAPRQPQNINHFKMSDISQFYIVKGRIYTHEELDLLEKRVNNPIKARLKRKHYDPCKNKLDSLKTTDPRGFNTLLREIKSKINFEYAVSDYLQFTPEQREVYTTVGGCPDLDGDYTVFGEVIEGVSVIDKIAALKTDKNDRPLNDVVITIVEN